MAPRPAAGPLLRVELPEGETTSKSPMNQPPVPALGGECCNAPPVAGDAAPAGFPGTIRGVDELQSLRAEVERLRALVVLVYPYVRAPAAVLSAFEEEMNGGSGWRDWVGAGA